MYQLSTLEQKGFEVKFFKGLGNSDECSNEWYVIVYFFVGYKVFCIVVFCLYIIFDK